MRVLYTQLGRPNISVGADLRLIVASSKDTLANRVKHHRSHEILVAFEYLDACSSIRIPHPNSLVVRTSDNHLAIIPAAWSVIGQWIGSETY